MRGIERCFTPGLPKVRPFFFKLHCFIQGVGMNSDSSLQSTVPNDHLVLEASFFYHSWGKNLKGFQVNNLVKRYGSKKFAVRGISFGVTEHECFGLLGVNGAGNNVLKRKYRVVSQAKHPHSKCLLATVEQRLELQLSLEWIALRQRFVDRLLQKWWKCFSASAIALNSTR